MLLTMDHCEVATKRTKAKPHRYWENAQLVPSNAYLISIDAENPFPFRCLNTDISRLRKVVLPFVMKDAAAENSSDFDRAKTV